MIITRKLSSSAALLVILLAVQASQANPNDFTVRTATGTNVFKLSEAKGKFVALHFLLKTECPYCIRHTHDYVKKSADDSEVVHVFLKPDTDDRDQGLGIQTWRGFVEGDNLSRCGRVVGQGLQQVADRHPPELLLKQLLARGLSRRDAARVLELVHAMPAREAYRTAIEGE